jgi:outer membrane lipoprotein-sorting protein
MRAKNLLVAGLIISALTLTHGARAADAPSVDSILAKHIEGMGGKAALEKVNSRVLKFKMESETIGASEGEIFAKAPNKQRSQIEVTGSGTINEGFDGSVGWAQTPWENLREMTGEELAKTKRDAEFHRDLKLKSIYPDLAYKGTEKVGEEEVYVLEAKPSASSKERFCLSTKTGLLLRQESQFEGPQGQVTLSLVPQDYKAFDGIKYPTQLKLKFSAGGQSFEFTMKVLEVKHNVKIEDTKFAKPSA